MLVAPDFFFVPLLLKASVKRVKYGASITDLRRIFLVKLYFFGVFNSNNFLFYRNDILFVY